MQYVVVRNNDGTIATFLSADFENRIFSLSNVSLETKTIPDNLKDLPKEEMRKKLWDLENYQEEKIRSGDS